MDYKNYRKKAKREESEDAIVYPRETLPDDIIFGNILSRLPADQLMHLKLLSKHWNSQITLCEYFIHSHLGHSMKHRKVFIEEPLEMDDPKNALSVIKRGGAPHCFLIGDYKRGNCQLGSVLQIYSMSTCGFREMTPAGMNPFCYRKLPGAVNGLTCFLQYYRPYFSVCVFNITTREVTPWLRSKARHNSDSLDNDDLGFGYCPTTKEHKVLWKWSTSHPSDMDNPPLDNIREVWEVLTVGKNKWRVIEDVVPFFVGKDAVSTYVNGTIYWLPKTGDAHYIGNLALAAFDVESEQFRKIQIESFDFGPTWEEDIGVCIHLLEVDGAVTVLRRMNEEYAMLWKYHEHNQKTTREILKFPLRWADDCQYYFHTGFSTNQIIVELHQIRQRPRLFSCSLRLGNWGVFQEILAEDGDFPLVGDAMDYSFFTFFCESLLRLSKSKECNVHGVSVSAQAAAVAQDPSPQESKKEASLPQEPAPDDSSSLSIV